MKYGLSFDVKIYTSSGWALAAMQWEHPQPQPQFWSYPSTFFVSIIPDLDWKENKYERITHSHSMPNQIKISMHGDRRVK